MIRDEILEIFPEINEIADTDLREKTTRTWEAALKKGGRSEARDIFSALSEDADAPAGVRRRAAEMIARIGPRRGVLTHMTIDLDYATLLGELPPRVEPGYDGMVLMA